MPNGMEKCIIFVPGDAGKSLFERQNGLHAPMRKWESKFPYTQSIFIMICDVTSKDIIRDKCPAYDGTSAYRL